MGPAGFKRERPSCGYRCLQWEGVPHSRRSQLDRARVNRGDRVGGSAAPKIIWTELAQVPAVTVWLGASRPSSLTGLQICHLFLMLLFFLLSHVCHVALKNVHGRRLIICLFGTSLLSGIRRRLGSHLLKDLRRRLGRSDRGRGKFIMHCGQGRLLLSMFKRLFLTL